jgi:hypothetical protein
MKPNISYPQYRKYGNGKSFFKVLSLTEFEEIQVSGDQLRLFEFEAKILPDRNYIQDLLFDYEAHWELCSAEEYETLKKKLD